MAKFIVEIGFSKDIADDIHRYVQTTTNGAVGFFDVLEENIDSVIRSMDPKGYAKIIEVIYND